MVAPLVFIVIVLLICLCSMHFNLRKAAELRANDLIELAQLQRNLAEHKRLHIMINQIMPPSIRGIKEPSLCDFFYFVRSDLQAAYKAGFIDAADNFHSIKAQVVDLPGAQESKDQMIDKAAAWLHQVANARACDYVAKSNYNL